MKKSLGGMWCELGGILPLDSNRFWGSAQFMALRILSSARESEVQVGDETKTQEGMSGEGQGQRGKESFECEMENLKLPFVSTKACGCSSVSPEMLFLHKSL